VPADDGLRLDDDKDVRPARPQARPTEPKGAVGHAHAWATRCAPEVGQLLAKGEVFERQFRAGVEGGTQRPDEVEKQGYHRETMQGVGGHGQTNLQISATVGKRAAMNRSPEVRTLVQRFRA